MPELLPLSQYHRTWSIREFKHRFRDGITHSLFTPQYFDRLSEVAEADYEGFVFEPIREEGTSG